MWVVGGVGARVGRGRKMDGKGGGTGAEEEKACMERKIKGIMEKIIKTGAKGKQNGCGSGRGKEEGEMHKG